MFASLMNFIHFDFPQLQQVFSLLMASVTVSVTHPKRRLGFYDLFAGGPWVKGYKESFLNRDISHDKDQSALNQGSSFAWCNRRKIWSKKAQTRYLRTSKILEETMSERLCQSNFTCI